MNASCVRQEAIRRKQLWIQRGERGLVVAVACIDGENTCLKGGSSYMCVLRGRELRGKPGNVGIMFLLARGSQSFGVRSL